MTLLVHLGFGFPSDSALAELHFRRLRSEGRWCTSVRARPVGITVPTWLSLRVQCLESRQGLKFDALLLNSRGYRVTKLYHTIRALGKLPSV